MVENINLKIHYPENRDAAAALKKIIAELHSDFVKEYIKKLNCPVSQKQQLLDKIISLSDAGHNV